MQNKEMFLLRQLMIEHYEGKKPIRVIVESNQGQG